VLLREVARAEVMPRFRNLGPGGVRTKTDALDVVTEADTAAEAAITAGLLRRFPGAVVVGEEATAADPSLLGRLGDADLAFVVDPVDGTANFADGLPLFAVMAAALIRGEVVAAGHLHFLLFNRLYPWDHAPGWLLHHEAGGYAAAFDASPYRPTRFDGGLIAAPDQASWQALRDALLGEA